ncbi:hypothetical protein V8E36_006806 [Tilletia maclaganii]
MLAVDKCLEVGRAHLFIKACALWRYEGAQLHKMRPFPFAVLLALLSAVHIDAFNWERDDWCVKVADAHCGNTKEHEDTQGWKIEYKRCLSSYWRSLPTDGNCPHRKIGCHCYQGCVKDRSPDNPDVGGYCVEACTLANLPSPDCG